jgi:hypothetical protein
MTTVTESDILQALHNVPAQEWGNVLKFVVSLQPTAGDSANGGADPPISTAADLARSDVVGMWADRKDVAEGHGFARQLREAAQRR